MKPSFAIVGCGKVGTALAIFLTRAGYRSAGFASKRLSSAKHVADRVLSDHFSDVPWDITRDADVVFITTPDSAVKDTCNSISRNTGFADNAVVMHCSGALASSVLSSAKTCGAWIGSMHPLQSFASTDHKTNPFQGIIVSLEGEGPAVNMAKTIAEDLGGTVVTLLTEAKTLYH
ncbi:MAG: NAD(P)-binding domain-containing protein, partial [Desulfobacterales bacterium]